MTADAVIKIVVEILSLALGSTAISAAITALINRRSGKASADKLILENAATVQDMLAEQMDNLKKDKAEMRQELEALKKDIENMREQLRLKDIRIMDLQEENSRMQSEIDELRAQLKDLFDGKHDNLVRP